jgi:type II secretion system protein G
MSTDIRQRGERGKSRPGRLLALAGRKASSERGFTLLELLVVVAIIGVIAAIAVVNLQSALDKSKQKKTMATIRSLANAVQAYQIDHSRYPAGGISNDELRSLLSPDMYNSVEVTDGWGHDIVYETDQSGYTMESYGRDGADGPADITAATRFEFDFDIVLVDGLFAYSPETN